MNKIVYDNIVFKDITKENNIITISGYPSTDDIDRVNDKVMPTAFSKSIETYIKSSGSIFFNHDWDRPVGKIVSYTPPTENTPLYITANIYKELGEDVYKMLELGVVKSFSVAFYTKEGAIEKQNGKDIYVIKEADLLDISVVSVPANPSANFTIMKSLIKGIDKKDIKELIDNLDNAKKDETKTNDEEFISVKKADMDCLLKAVGEFAVSFDGLMIKLSLSQTTEIKKALSNIHKILGKE